MKTSQPLAPSFMMACPQQKASRFQSRNLGDREFDSNSLSYQPSETIRHYRHPDWAANAFGAGRFQRGSAFRQIVPASLPIHLAVETETHKEREDVAAHAFALSRRDLSV